MSADWERLVKAPCEAETFKPVGSGTRTLKTRSKRAARLTWEKKRKKKQRPRVFRFRTEGAEGEGE